MHKFHSIFCRFNRFEAVIDVKVPFNCHDHFIREFAFIVFLLSFSTQSHEDPHTTFFCTAHDAGVVKDARF